MAQASARPVAWQKSLVGPGVYTHESGIHVDGLIKDPLNYQGVDPAAFGRRHDLVLGKHSGTQGVLRAYGELGIALNRRQASDILHRLRRFVSSAKRPPRECELRDFLEEAGRV